MRDFPTKPYSSPSSSPLCQHDLILPLLLLLLSFLISSPSSPSPRHFPARHPYSSSSSPPKITDGRPAGGAWLRLGPAALQHGRSTFGRERRLERVRRAATSHGLLPTPPSSFSSIIISPIPHHLTLIVKCRAPGCRMMPTTWEPTWAWESAANLSGPGNLPGPGNHDFSQPAKAFSLQPSMLSEPSTNFPLLPPVNLGCVCLACGPRGAGV